MKFYKPFGFLLAGSQHPPQPCHGDVQLFAVFGNGSPGNVVASVVHPVADFIIR